MNYWLSPKGKVYKNDDIGRHYEMAVDIITDKFPELLDKHCLSQGVKLYTGRNAVEELENRGYIRYMDWSNSPRWIIYNQKPTSRQKEMMFSLTKFLYE